MKKTLHAIITDLCPKFKTLCTRAAKTLRSRHYIRANIGTGRSETPLIAASQVVIYSVFLVFEQAGPNLSLLQIAKLRWFSRLSRLFRTSTHKEKVRGLATAGLNLARLQILNWDEYVWLNKLPERRPIGVRVQGIFEQAGPNLTSAEIVILMF